MSEERIRGIIRDKLRAGKLPWRQSDRTWGGRGTGRTCAACDEQVSASESEIEDRDDEGITRVFHARCHGLLNLERDLAAGGNARM